MISPEKIDLSRATDAQMVELVGGIITAMDVPAGTFSEAVKVLAEAQRRLSDLLTHGEVSGMGQPVSRRLLRGHERALEAGHRAGMVSNGCGATVEGEHVFCDDPRLSDGVRCSDCSCKTDSEAAISAYLAALPQAEPVDDMSDILREPLQALKVFLASPPLNGEAVLAQRIAASPTPAEPSPATGVRVTWPEYASQLPWKYVRVDHGLGQVYDRIEDASGGVVVEHVGHIDGPAICAAVNLSTPILKGEGE